MTQQSKTSPRLRRASTSSDERKSNSSRRRTRIPTALPLQTRSQSMTAPEAYHRARIASEKIREAKAKDRWEMRGSAR